MGTTTTNSVHQELKTKHMKESLLTESRVMLDFCLSQGKVLDTNQIAILDKADEEISAIELLPVHNYLVNFVKPAKPGTLVLFEKNRQSKSRLKFLGPLPIVRQFMLLTIVSLFALIGVSLSPHINTDTIQLSMLQGEGIDQIERLAFLLACASVGASFYALFKMNSYIADGTFDTKYTSTYWSRFVLGLVAGILLSELFVVFINTDAAASGGAAASKKGLNEDEVVDSAGYLLKPILAILGGFSASLVYRIMNRLIEAIESVFKGSTEAVIQQKQQEVLTQAQDSENSLRNVTAQQLLSLKSELVSSNVPPELLAKVDDAIGGLVPFSKKPVYVLAEDTATTADNTPEEEVTGTEEPQEEPTPVEQKPAEAPAKTTESDQKEVEKSTASW